MKHTLARTAFMIGTAAAVFAAPGLSIEASAKIKEQKFHFVNDAFHEPIVMNMKYQNGSWKWINSNKTFKKRVKLKARASKKFGYSSVSLGDAGRQGYRHTIWQQALGYKTKKVEELHTFTVGKTILAGSQNAAATKCNAFGGHKQVTTGMTLPALFHVEGNGRRGVSGVKSGLHINVVCEARAKPAQPKIAKINFYTVPAKPVCNKPVSIVANFHGTHPGKYNFTLVRNDGASQKNSAVLSYAKPLSTGQFMKTYTFDKTTKRRYQIVMANQAMTSKWIDVAVTCGAKGSASKGGIKS